MTSQGVLLRRPLPPNLPSADADGCKYNAKPVVAPKQKVKSDDDGQIGNGSVSQRFDLLQRMKQSEQELMNLFKPRGPDAFPKREPRKKALSTLAKYYEDCNTKPAPNLPDFVCDTDERFCETLVPPIAKPVISICTWDKAPQSKYGGVSAVDQQVMNGVYVGETAPLPDIQPRKPWRQVLIESQAQMSEAPVCYDYTKALAPYYHCVQADIEQSELELVSKLMQNHPDLYLLVRGEALSGAPPAFRESPLLALHDGDALQDGEVYQFGTCDASQAERKRDHPNKACEDASLAEDSEVLALAILSIRGPVSALDDPNVADQSGGCWDRDEAHAKEIVSADAAILNCLTHGGARLNLKLVVEMSCKTPKTLRLRQRQNVSKDHEFTASNDFICPICLELLIYPVTMPCKHELCLDCFKRHVQDTSLTCPMCRLRISIWTRKNVKTKSLVNEARWKLIQELFPERCRRRLSGEDDIDDSIGIQNDPGPVVCTTGELRKEYEEEVKKIRAEDEYVLNQDLTLVQELSASESALLESARKQEELDELTAKQLQEEEMKSLGVTLSSPSEHQQEILNLFRPMQLRKRVVPASTVTGSSQATKITNYFLKSSCQPSQNLAAPGQSSDDPGFGFSKIDMDQEIAQKLQAQFDAEREGISKRANLKAKSVCETKSKRSLLKNFKSPLSPKSRGCHRISSAMTKQLLQPLLKKNRRDGEEIPVDVIQQIS